MNCIIRKKSKIFSVARRYNFHFPRFLFPLAFRYFFFYRYSRTQRSSAKNVSWREMSGSHSPTSSGNVEWYCLSCRSCARQLVKHHRPISKARVIYTPFLSVRCPIYSVAIATAKRSADHPEQMTTHGDWRWQHSTFDNGHFVWRKINSFTSKIRGRKSSFQRVVCCRRSFLAALEKKRDTPSRRRDFYNFSIREISRDWRERIYRSRNRAREEGLSRNIAEQIRGEITRHSTPRYRINTPIVKRSTRPTLDPGRDTDDTRCHARLLFPWVLVIAVYRKLFLAGRDLRTTVQDGQVSRRYRDAIDGSEEFINRANRRSMGG